jgi:hypothetical protein
MTFHQLIALSTNILPTNYVIKTLCFINNNTDLNIEIITNISMMLKLHNSYIVDKKTLHNSLSKQRSTKCQVDETAEHLRAYGSVYFDETVTAFLRGNFIWLVRRRLQF